MLYATLSSIVDDVCDEIGLAANTTSNRNIRNTLMRYVRRQYKRFHSSYDWPHLVIERGEVLKAGGRFYSFPADLDFARTETVYFVDQETGEQTFMPYGISTTNLNRINSNTGARRDKPRRWQLYEGKQYEVWPVPDHNGDTLRLRGLSVPKTLKQDADKVDLDSDLLALFAAGEWLARQKSADAQIKFQQAQDFYTSLKAQSQKQPVVLQASALDRYGYGYMEGHPQVEAPER